MQVKLATSIKGRHKSNYEFATPSPAAYSSNNISYNAQKQASKIEFSFGKETRKLDVKEGPAPDTYSLQNSRVKSGVVFGKEERLKT